MMGAGAPKGGAPQGGAEPFDVPLESREPDGISVTALDLLQEALNGHAKRSGRFEAKALRNELYFHGDQFRDVNESTGDVEDLDWLADVPQRSFLPLNRPSCTYSSSASMLSSSGPSSVPSSARIRTSWSPE